MLKKIKRLFILLCLLSVVTFGVGYHQLSEWANTARVLTEPVEFNFSSGMSLKQLSVELETRGLVTHRYFFLAYVRLQRNYHKFQAGIYRFEDEVSPLGIINHLLTGKIYEKPLLTFTIPEGFTVTQVINRLVANGIGSQKKLERLVNDKSFLKSMGIKTDSIEGFIYPATYSFYVEIPKPEDAIKKMVAKFFESLPNNYESQVEAKGLTLYDAVKFASLIEMESFHKDENSKISEVIWNRLKSGTPLAIDAAVIYGIEGYEGDIKWKHLKDAKNPYNTRIHKGLPPTPIGAVSRESLEAVLTPTDEGYFYYVLLDDDSKKHHFSKSLEEHNRYVKRLLKKSRN